MQLGADPVVAVLGHQRAAVEAALVARFGADAVTVVEQTEQRGTGHAVKLAMAALKGFTGDLVLVLYGDVPLLRRETLAALVGTARRYRCLAVVTATPPDPTGYGRILRDERGHVISVVEEKDASPEERALTEVNAGIYCGPVEFFREATAGLSAPQRPARVLPDRHHCPRRRGDRRHRRGGRLSRRRRRQRSPAARRGRGGHARPDQPRAMAHVTFRDPATTDVEPGVEVGVDVELGRGVALRGRTKIGHGARIGDGVILTDCEVGAGVLIRPYCVATEAVIGVGATVGPFAHLRPGTNIGPDAHIGNFVETKKTTLGRGSKANHLTYLGDTVVGEKVNIGAGTITCNYNGYEKSKTVIDDGAFIGSDTQLVAPVRVGKGAVIGAGTTVTEDVPAGALVITRATRTEKPGYAQKVAKKYAAARKSG